MSEQTKIHPQIEMGEVRLKVSNLARSLRFYEDVLGFRVAKQDAAYVELAASDGNVLVLLDELGEGANTPAKRTSGLYHFALLLPSRQDLGLVLRRLIDKDIEIGQADHAVSEALYISDPDGHGIEIYRDRPRSEWTYDVDGNIHMVTEPIDWYGLLLEAEGQAWQGLPAGTKMGHVHLHVHDLAAARQFYCGQLGFDMMLDGSQRMGALFVAAGGYHHHLGLNIWAGRGASKPAENDVGLKYYTIRFPNQEALQEVIERLRESGQRLKGDGKGWLVQDPSGITLRMTYSLIE